MIVFDRSKAIFLAGELVRRNRWLPHQADCWTVNLNLPMTTRRGTPLEINPALNKTTTKFGVDYRLLAACLFVSIVVFLFGSKLLACLMLPSLITAGALLTMHDPRMFRLWLLSFKLGSYYDPGK